MPFFLRMGLVIILSLDRLQAIKTSLTRTYVSVPYIIYELKLSQ